MARRVAVLELGERRERVGAASEELAQGAKETGRPRQCEDRRVAGGVDEAQRDRGEGEAEGGELLARGVHLGGGGARLGLQMLARDGTVAVNVGGADGRADAARLMRRAHFEALAGGEERTARDRRSARGARDDLELRDGCYAVQRLAAKAERHWRATLQLGERGELRGGIAFADEEQLVGIHATTIVAHADGKGRHVKRDGDVSRAGVNGVAHELLDNGGKPRECDGGAQARRLVRGEPVYFDHRDGNA